MQPVKLVLSQTVPQYLRKSQPSSLPSVAGSIPTCCPHCGAEKRLLDIPGVGKFQILADDCCNARLFDVVVSRLQSAYHILTSPEDQVDLKQQAKVLGERLTPDQKDYLNHTLIPQLKQQQEQAATFRDQHPALRGPATGEVAK